MKQLSRIVTLILLLGLFVSPAQAFTSLRIFGDGISTTTNNVIVTDYPQTYGTNYYGLRECNGRVWVEVLAQRLGLGANSITNVNWSNASNNWSYYGQYSFNLMTNINHFAKPADAGTALFVLWVNNADFVNDMANVYNSSGSQNSTNWNNAINQSLTNHWNIITNLYYSKGCRTLIAPNAVDITEIPAYDGLVINNPATRNFIRQQVINFNTRYAALLNQARALGLTIYEPDFFTLLDNVLTNASAYGLTNALNSQGVSSDALDILYPNLSMNGAGANYIFWDATDPSAKLHEIMADEALQIIAPAQISGIAVIGNITQPTVNQLTIANMPVGLNGFVDGSTNVGTSWAPVANITGTSTTQVISFTAPPLPIFVMSGSSSLPFSGSGSGSGSGSQNNNNTVASTNSVPGEVETYHLRFPLAWNWP